jgi:hypothetical protein
VGVDSMTHFYDLELANKAAHYLEEGHNPYVDGSYNEKGTLTNYPEPLLRLISAYCTLMGGSDNAGIVLACVTLFLIGYLSSLATFSGGFLLGLGITLGGGALALERGNSDLILFVLVVAIAVLPLYTEKFKNTYAAALLSVLLVCIATVLKLYPIFALASCLALKEKKAILLASGLSVILVLIYFFLNFSFIEVLLANTGISTKNSYGFYATAGAYPFKVPDWDVLKFLFYVLISTLSFVTYKALSNKLFTFHSLNYRYSLCLTGTAIFAGTYLCINSFDYRLLFGLLAVPYLCKTYKQIGVWVSAVYVLFSGWSVIENNIFWYVPWSVMNEKCVLFARHILGLGLVSLALGWLFQQVRLRLEG